MASPDDRCETCFFYKSQTLSDGSVAYGCHQTSPLAGWETDKKTGNVLWPKVDADDWCGMGRSSSTGANFS